MGQSSRRVQDVLSCFISTSQAYDDNVSVTYWIHKAPQLHRSICLSLNRPTNVSNRSQINGTKRHIKCQAIEEASERASTHSPPHLNSQNVRLFNFDKAHRLYIYMYICIYAVQRYPWAAIEDETVLEFRPSSAFLLSEMCRLQWQFQAKVWRLMRIIALTRHEKLWHVLGRFPEMIIPEIIHVRVPLPALWK